MTDPTRPSRQPRPALLATCAFVVGMGVMIIEITASRILAPHYGASLFVWTSIIVTVLLALSLGYWLGGNIAETGAGMRVLGYMLASSGVLLIVGVWAVELLTRGISSFFMGWSDAMPFLFMGSLLASFIVFAAPVFLLAMSGPLILKAWAAHGGDLGRVSGRYFAVSTIGSVVGTLAPSLVTVPMFGAKATMAGVAAIFFVLAAVVAVEDRRVAYAAVLVLPLALLALPDPSYSAETIYAVESPYQLIRVEEDEWGRRFLIFNEGSGVQSVWYPDAARTGLYYDNFAAVPALHEAPPRDALMLGLAGGTGVRQYLAGVPDAAGLHIIGVEVDPAVIRTASAYFGLDELPVEVVVQDGRAYLDRTELRFDDIIIDAYSTQLYIAPHLATEEFFRLVRSKLREGGIVTMNINAASEDSRLLIALLNTISSAFPNVAYVPAGSWNYLVLASETPIDLSRAAAGLPQGYADVGERMAGAVMFTHDPALETFTDDRAPIEMLTDSMILQAAMGLGQEE